MMLSLFKLSSFYVERNRRSRILFIVTTSIAPMLGGTLSQNIANKPEVFSQSNSSLFRYVSLDTTIFFIF